MAIAQYTREFGRGKARARAQAADWFGQVPAGCVRNGRAGQTGVPAPIVRLVALVLAMAGSACAAAT